MRYKKLLEQTLYFYEGCPDRQYDYFVVCILREKMNVDYDVFLGVLFALEKLSQGNCAGEDLCSYEHRVKQIADAAVEKLLTQ